MKRDERRRAIMDLLVDQGAVELDDLAQRYTVSRMTIHRDLDDLESSGLLRKIRGGATIEAGTRFESDFRLRERQGIAAKHAISDLALELVEPGMTVMVNDGSMAAVLGAALVEKRPVTVITNNGAIIDALKSEPGVSLIVLGGVYSAKFNAYLGMVTEDATARLHADIAFISAPAVSGRHAFHMDDTVVRAKRAMIEAATRCCLMINHARFAHTALHRLADLDEFDWVLSDRLPNDAALRALEQAGVTLDVAQQKECRNERAAFLDRNQLEDEQDAGPGAGLRARPR